MAQIEQQAFLNTVIAMYKLIKFYENDLYKLQYEICLTDSLLGKAESGSLFWFLITWFYELKIIPINILDMCNKYYINNQYYHENPYKKIWGFSKKYKGLQQKF